MVCFGIHNIRNKATKDTSYKHSKWSTVFITNHLFALQSNWLSQSKTYVATLGFVEYNKKNPWKFQGMPITYPVVCVQMLLECESATECNTQSMFKVKRPHFTCVLAFSWNENIEGLKALAETEGTRMREITNILRVLDPLLNHCESRWLQFDIWKSHCCSKTSQLI